MRGRFLRGRDGGANNDPDKTTRIALFTLGATGDNVGSYQADELKGHNHSFSATGTTGDGGSGTVYNRGGDGGPYFTNNFNTTNTGGTETRPKNAYVNFIIKAQ